MAPLWRGRGLLPDTFRSSCLCVAAVLRCLCGMLTSVQLLEHRAFVLALEKRAPAEAHALFASAACVLLRCPPAVLRSWLRTAPTGDTADFVQLCGAVAEHLTVRRSCVEQWRGDGI
jgi:hypothetical protein